MYIDQLQNAVREFMLQAQQECPIRPTSPLPHSVRSLRLALICEELGELTNAVNKNDMVEIADAIADLLYVVIGIGIAYGIDMEPIFAEVHRSNMSKFIDGYRDSNGKWIKGPCYSPANLVPIIQAQLTK